MPKVDLSQIEQTNRTGYPPPYDQAVAGRLYRRVGQATGLQDIGQPLRARTRRMVKPAPLA